LPWEDWRAGEDEHTSAWMRATSPSGAAEFEGLVSWAGELGYGVREPEHGQTVEVPEVTSALQADDPEEQVGLGVDAQTRGNIDPHGHPLSVDHEIAEH
jgi:hypothetical protein